MKRFQSILCASLLTLALSTTAFAGDIHTVTANGDIHTVTTNGDIHTVTTNSAGDIHTFYDYILVFLAQMAL